MEATSHLIGNKIADKITRVSKTSPQGYSEINEEEILWEKFILPELRQLRQAIDNSKLKEDNF